MGEIIIRPARKGDLEICQKIFKTKALRFPEGTYADKKYLTKYLNKEYFLVAERNKEVVGSILGESLKHHHVLVWFFAVKKELRNKGIGEKLLKQIEKTAIKNKKKWIILYAPKFPKSVFKFYRKRSFKRGHTFIELERELK